MGKVINNEEYSKQLQEESYEFPYHYLIEFDTQRYSDFSQSKNYSAGYRYAAYLIHVIEEIRNLEFKNLADVGCGEGFFIHKLSQMYSNIQFTGIDISKHAIDFAWAFNSSPNINFLMKNILIDDLDQKFEIITLIEVLEHIHPDSIDNFLKSIHNMLNTDGKLLLTVPSTNLSIKNIKRHFQHFTSKTLSDTLSPYFHVNKVNYLNKHNLCTKFIDRIFTNSIFILNNRKLLNKLFSIYLRKYLRANSKNGLRLFALCSKKRLEKDLE